jgi:hypothetical protein
MSRGKNSNFQQIDQNQLIAFKVQTPHADQKLRSREGKFVQIQHPTGQITV